MATSVARAEHCYFCFQVLEAELNGEPDPVPPFDGSQQYPLFVTWNIWPVTKRASTSPRLRGCIGTFEPQSLGKGLSEYASIAAFNDHRFSPITSSELARLQCGVSFLTGFEECEDYLDWDIGTHGIYIHLPNPVLAPKALIQGGNDDSASSSSGSTTPARESTTSRSKMYLTATYLPDVIPAQDWTKEEAIDSAIRKAGFTGKITPDVRRALRVQRYRSDKMERSYGDYQAWTQQ